MKSLILLSLLTGSMALAQQQSVAPSNAGPIKSANEIELSCRIKAKEIAAETYRGCVTEQKNSQIDQIKKEYQQKLKNLKSHYESELKKMSGAKAAANEAKELDKADDKAGEGPVPDAGAVKSEDLIKPAPDKASEQVPSTEQQTSDSLPAIVQTTESAPETKAAELPTTDVKSVEVKALDEKVEGPATEAEAKAAPAPVKKEVTAPVAKKKKVSKASAKKAPTNKIATKKSTLPAKVATEKKSEVSKISSITEMTVQLKPAPKKSATAVDGSSRDLPEPIPVENVRSGT